MPRDRAKLRKAPKDEEPCKIPPSLLGVRPTADLPAERPVPPPWRWPPGTGIAKFWDGKEWVAVVTIGEHQFTAKGTNSFACEHAVTALYREWLAQQGGKSDGD